MTDLTPAQKRKITLEARLGANWAKKVGKLAKDAKIEKHGEDGFTDLQSNAGKIGGTKTKAANRPFSKNKKLAQTAGAKGAYNRWGKLRRDGHICVIPGCNRERANTGHADKPARSKFCNYHRKGKGIAERVEWQASND